MTWSTKTTASLTLLLAASALAGPQGIPLPPAAQALQEQQPRVKFYTHAGQIRSVYGPAFVHGDTPEQAAERFVTDYAGIFGVQRDNLVLIRTNRLMRDQFTVFRYDQQVGGYPVFETGLRVLVRHDADNGVVLVNSNLVPLERMPEPVVNITAEQALETVKALSPAHAGLTWTEPSLIWVTYDAGEEHPTVLAWQTVGANNDLANPFKMRYFVDAATGRIVREYSEIHYEDIVGNVSGYATQGVGADICGPEELEPMPYARVNVVGGNTAFADVNGDFVIPNSGTDPVTVQSPVRGRWFFVDNQGGPDSLLQEVVDPPGPVFFEHNQSNSEFTTAEVNGYVQANVVRDFTLFYAPDYPVIGGQTDFRVNVNISSTCNAFYDGASINFFRSGGGCANTAFSTVVHHEYGHHLVQVAGSGQGQYGEGMGDVMGVLITDDPILARGFTNNCNQGIRNADNNIQYPCSGEIHFCGQLISGCVWHTRQELAVSDPDNARDIISFLAVNAMPLHVGDLITPQITIDYLTLDDDDGDIGNGTPHYNEIDAGFGRHNMPAPPLEFVDFEYPAGRPDFVQPNQPVTFQVRITPVTGEPDPSTGMIHWRVGGGAFNADPLNFLGNDLYEATLPGADCGETIEWYLSILTTDGDEARDPQDAPASVYTVFVASNVVTVLDDNFETDQGWTVENQNVIEGGWQRGVPLGGGDRGDPPSDWDGSGRLYETGTADGVDLDGGPTILTSPRLSMPDGGIIKYARWFSNDDGDDTFRAQISNDDGASWVTLETQTGGVGGWVERTFNVADFVTPSDQIRVRFSAADQPNNSVTEAAIDAFQAIGLECLAGLPGDFDGDGDVDIADFGFFTSCFTGAGVPCTGQCCDADLDGDGDVDIADFAIFAENFTGN